MHLSESGALESLASEENMFLCFKCFKERKLIPKHTETCPQGL